MGWQLTGGAAGLAIGAIDGLVSGVIVQGAGVRGGGLAVAHGITCAADVQVQSATAALAAASPQLAVLGACTHEGLEGAIEGHGSGLGGEPGQGCELADGPHRSVCVEDQHRDVEEWPRR